MAKIEKKPKVYRIKLYDTLEEELKSIREEARIREERKKGFLFSERISFRILLLML